MEASLRLCGDLRINTFVELADIRAGDALLRAADVKLVMVLWRCLKRKTNCLIQNNACIMAPT